MATIGEVTSRIRNGIKSVKEDAFLTDRYLYSMFMKYAKALVKRESQRKNIYTHTSLFKEIPCLELMEVDKVAACCLAVNIGLTFKRSREKLPRMITNDKGPLIKSVSSVDYSQNLTETHPTVYANMTKTSGFKYNKSKYYWIIDDYLYVPDNLWEAVRLQAMFEDDISPLLCDLGAEDESCEIKQNMELAIPEHLYMDIETLVRNEIAPLPQLPSDGSDDQQNVIR